MKFFIPGSTNETKNKEVYDAIKMHAQTTIGWEVKDKKIYHLKFKHDGNTYEAKVGETTSYNNEPVIAILESNVTYFVCTINRGVIRGEPILVGRNDVISIYDFEPD